MLPHLSIHKYNWSSSGAKIHNQVDQVLLAKRWHTM